MSMNLGAQENPQQHPPIESEGFPCPFSVLVLCWLSNAERTQSTSPTRKSTTNLYVHVQENRTNPPQTEKKAIELETPIQTPIQTHQKHTPYILYKNSKSKTSTLACSAPLSTKVSTKRCPTKPKPPVTTHFLGTSRVTTQSQSGAQVV